MSKIRIERFDPPTASEDELRALFDVVGFLEAALDDSGTNRSLVHMSGGVLAEQGDRPAEAFLAGLGATRRLVERRSRCLVSDIDRHMLEQWVERAAERAGAYSLLVFTSPVPEEYIKG
ncbi:MAG: hypothetical protein ACR2H3_06110 [Acidimicrobiales bacterium]